MSRCLWFISLHTLRALPAIVRTLWPTPWPPAMHAGPPSALSSQCVTPFLRSPLQVIHASFLWPGRTATDDISKEQETNGRYLLCGRLRWFTVLSPSHHPLLHPFPAAPRCARPLERYSISLSRKTKIRSYSPVNIIRRPLPPVRNPCHRARIYVGLQSDRGACRSSLSRKRELRHFSFPDLLPTAVGEAGKRTYILTDHCMR